MILLIGLGLSVAAPIQAQGDYPRAEIFGGYSYLRTDLNIPKGWNASVAGYPHRNIGLEADFSGHYGRQVGFDHGTHLFLIGPRFGARLDRVTAYTHVLIGATRVRTEGQICDSPPCLNRIQIRESETSLAWALGGGLDIRIGKHVALRAIQADYLRLERRAEFQFSQYVGSSIRIVSWPSNNLRLSFGVVLRLGGG